MNKKVIGSLIVALLFFGGAANLCADELDTPTEDTAEPHERTESLAEPDVTPCGDGNGGGSTPG